MLAAAIERFSASARNVEPGPWLDPRSRIAYALMMLWGAASVAILTLTNFTAEDWPRWMMFLSLCWAALCGALARRYGLDRVAAFLEAVAIPPIIGALGCVLVISAASISGRFADDKLIVIDTALGFDWLALFHFYQAHPWLVPISDQAYTTFGPQLVLVPLLIFLARRELLWRYITAYILTLGATILVFPLAPAVGPYVYFHIPFGLLPGIGEGSDWQWHFGEWIAQLQSGEIRDITKVSAGLIQMPSFHAACGVLFIWATNRIRYVRWPALLLNLAMILSTFVRGAHYFSDVLAGCMLALLAIWVASKFVPTDMASYSATESTRSRGDP